MTYIPAPLTARQKAVAIAFGAVLWLSGAIAIRLIAPLGAFEGWMAVASYTVIIPLTWGFIAAGRALIGLAPGQLLRGVTVIALTAMILDALALRLAPALYGDQVEHHFLGAAYLLWGFAIAFLLALAMERET